MRASEDILQMAIIGEAVNKGLDGLFMPNFHFLWHEADLIYVTKRGYATEYEIKISKSDYKSDKKKTCGNLSKSEYLVQGKGANYFYYVMPKGMVNVNDIPVYAGLIEVDLSKYYGTIDYVKIAPKLHKNKNETIIKKIYEKAYYRYLERVVYPQVRKFKKELNKQFIEAYQKV